MKKLQRYRLIYAGFISLFIISGCASVTQGGQSSGKNTKDVLLIFTGSDWSEEAALFSKDVLTDTFRAEIAKNYTVRFIDLLRNPPEQEKKNARKNYLLFSEYAVTEVPFIVLQTAEQDMYASAVVEAEVKTEAQLIDKINALAEQRAPVAEARHLINTTQGIEKAKAIDAFLSSVGNAESRRYDSLRMQVPALDPDNRSGLKGKYVLISADIRAKAFAQQGDYLKAGDEYKTAAETGFLTSAELQLAWYLAAYSYLMEGSIKTETVIGYLRKAIEADPHGTGVRQINQAIKKLQKSMQ